MVTVLQSQRNFRIVLDVLNRGELLVREKIGCTS